MKGLRFTPKFQLIARTRTRLFQPFSAGAKTIFALQFLHPNYYRSICRPTTWLTRQYSSTTTIQSTSSKNNAFAIPESLITQAEMGNFEAQCRLALLYAAPPSDADSESVQNFERAFYWNSRAVNDHTNPSPEAIAALGLARFSGKGCEADSAAAFVLLSRAADLGLVDAQAIVSDMLFHGLGVDIDLKRAFYYSKLAADQNHKLSILKLASMYLMGDGVMPDVDQAKIYARNATGEEIDFVNPGQWLHDKMDQLMDEEVNAK